jgi:hypothetical protein
MRASGRRTNRVHGLVNFPVDDPKWKSTREGGMFVRLVVVPPEGLDALDYPVCCGGLQHIVYTEDLIDPQLEKEHYLRLEDDKDSNQFISIGYLAVLYLGSTGWSGADENGDYWQCQGKDLSREGRKLMDLLSRLHPKCRVQLQTWLDT